MSMITIWKGLFEELHTKEDALLPTVDALTIQGNNVGDFELYYHNKSDKCWEIDYSLHVVTHTGLVRVYFRVCGSPRDNFDGDFGIAQRVSFWRMWDNPWGHHRDYDSAWILMQSRIDDLLQEEDKLELRGNFRKLNGVAWWWVVCQWFISLCRCTRGAMEHLWGALDIPAIVWVIRISVVYGQWVIFLFWCILL